MRRLYFGRIRPFLRLAWHSIFVRRGRLGNGSDRSRLGWTSPIRFIEIENNTAVQEWLSPFQNSVAERHAFSDRAVWQIDDATFDLRNGVAYINSHAVFESMGGSATKTARKFRGFGFRAQRQTDSFLATGGHPPNYYHWLIEDLPATVRASRASGHKSVLVREGGPGYIGESLSQFGLTSQTLQRRYIRGSAVIGGRSNDSGWPHPSDLEILQELAGEEGTPRRRLYITRRGFRRSFSNELEVERFFSDAGFEVFAPHQHSFDSQLAAFRSASVIVGGHGAGLSNIVFCVPGARVIEISNMKHTIPCFELMARWGRLDFSRVVIGSERGSESTRIADKERQSILGLAN